MPSVLQAFPVVASQVHPWAHAIHRLRGTLTGLADHRAESTSRDLDGPWFASKAGGPTWELSADGASPEGWAATPVPSHWQLDPGMADENGPVQYIHRFPWPTPPPERRVFVVFDGIYYSSEVWLDGSFLGLTEGYFVPHAFDVTDRLRSGGQHTLAVEVSSPAPGSRSAITGTLGDRLFVGDRNGGGLWRRARMEETGPVRISQLRLACLDADDQRAVLVCDAELDAAAACTVELRTYVDHAAETQAKGDVAAVSEFHQLAAGTNRVEWRVPVEAPRLWWPASLGEQPLYDVRVEAAMDGIESHRRKRRTGLRHVAIEDGALRLNGEALAPGGVNLTPRDPFLGLIDRARAETLVRTAAGHGFDLIRVHAHVNVPELYREADRLGMMIWQDLPLRRAMARGVRTQAVRQTVTAVDLLAHHPSIVVWAAHDEPGPVPSWDALVLDPAVRRALRRADPSRPVIGATHNEQRALHRRLLPRRASTRPGHLRIITRTGRPVDPDRLRSDIGILRSVDQRRGGAFILGDLLDLVDQPSELVAAANRIGE